MRRTFLSRAERKISVPASFAVSDEKTLDCSSLVVTLAEMMRADVAPPLRDRAAATAAIVAFRGLPLDCIVQRLSMFRNLERLRRLM